MNQRDEWDSILDPDEQVIWQGRPDTKIALSPFNMFETIFGVFFAGFALFWMTQAAKAEGSFWMFGILHFSVGVGTILHALFWSSFKRAHTWYTLSNRRAFIGTNLPLLGKKLVSYPIDESTPLQLVDGSPASVFFASETRTRNRSTRVIQIGFERIQDGKSVYRKLRDIQLRDSVGE